ncbi:hypothetical protein ACQTO0_14545 [Brucella sp. NF 2815]|uniref:hypothetical protein n=1 Tax=Brucella sp. NF 2815 TaxID=3419592 RepID=UPI003D167898
MPRNGQGVYSLPPVYEAVTGETIEAQQHNVPLEDIASDLNNARPISTGGTGGQSATQARENLDVYSKAESIQAIGDIPAKETPVDADNVVIVDSEDGNKPKKSKVNALVNTMRVGVAMAGANSKETLDDGDFLGGVLADGSTAFKTPWGKSRRYSRHFLMGAISNSSAERYKVFSRFPVKDPNAEYSVTLVTVIAGSTFTPAIRTGIPSSGNEQTARPMYGRMAKSFASKQMGHSWYPAIFLPVVVPHGWKQTAISSGASGTTSGPVMHTQPLTFGLRRAQQLSRMIVPTKCEMKLAGN